jgi:hypothetical protein
MGKITLFIMFLFPLTLQANLLDELKSILPEGDHLLAKEHSSDGCMDGTISYVEYDDEGKKSQVFLLSSRVGFSIDQSEKKEHEKIEEGCEYHISTIINKQGITRETVRQGCPVESENTKIIEEVSLIAGGFKYSLQDKDYKRVCHYKFATSEATR